MPQERKKKQFSVRVYDQKHLRNLSKRLRKVQRLLDEAAKEGAAIGARTGYKDIAKDFRFDDFSQARREIDALLRELSTALTINVEEANSEAWCMANAKNDAMVDAMLSTAGIEAAKKITQPWYNKNARALGAFQKRVKDGMGLSTDVWNLGQFKGELELALEMGLGRGKSAAELSRDVRSYLKYPNKLFRRVRDEKGVLRLSKAAKEFHPGRGVYRSSYKNALRLTATETNMAYRTADSKRWQQIDFVLGIRIQVSKTNHPVTDICDELAGDYPKDFVFTGWHPFCKCFATSILPPPDKFIEYMNASDEERKNWQWEGEVKDVPDSFKGWVQDNEERIAKAKSLPYFLKDNPQYVAGVREKTAYDIGEKVVEILRPTENRAYIAFDPFSPIVVEKIREQRDLKHKLRLFGEIINDERATVLNSNGEIKTVVFPGHKGRQHSTWKGIVKMAKDINNAGESVAFLPELDNYTSADALILFRGKPHVADFKYCITTKANTLAVDLITGFEQAGTVVVKLERMDAGQFKEAVDYLVRNNIPYGNVKLINKRGDLLEISKKEIRVGAYKKKIKGFL